MEIIENFAELSIEEQKAFAEALVKTINSESTFTDDTNFKVTGIETDDLAGDLVILIEPEDPIEVPREATWTCSNSEDRYDDPGYDADYDNSIYDDAKKAFKTMTADIEGYRVSLEVDDLDEVETADIEVDDYSDEDAGIGHYEYWGHTGYDSRPYVEVTGTIIKACTCYLSLYVEPSGATEPATDEEAE